MFTGILCTRGKVCRRVRIWTLKGFWTSLILNDFIFQRGNFKDFWSSLVLNDFMLQRENFQDY
jgi:hypothetical protein